MLIRCENMGFLEQILMEKKAAVKELKSKMSLREVVRMAAGKEKRPFFEQFSRRFPDDVRIIAEVKKASPSRGVLAGDLDVAKLMREYEEGGARAISVITEEKYFKGSLTYIAEAKRVTSLPVLRKDFIVDEYEIYEARAAGADAVLLIGEALDRYQAKDYLEIAQSIDLDVLMEVHSLATYEKIADLKGYLLGINNRDLKSLKVDLSTSREILDSIPSDFPVVIESGIDTRQDIESFVGRGVSGFLIGTSLILSSSPREKLRELRGEA
jgi:indole-3-glycerol phosphate synthase